MALLKKENVFNFHKVGNDIKYTNNDIISHYLFYYATIVVILKLSNRSQTLQT